jgi:putative transposase
LANRSSAESRLTQRAKIILEVASRANDSEVARRLDIHRKTVGKWRHRYLERRRAEPDKPVAVWLADANRVGRPDTFDELFWLDVMALATSHPEASGRPITHWTQRELADEVVVRRLAESISHSTIGRFLASCQLKPLDEPQG